MRIAKTFVRIWCICFPMIKSIKLSHKPSSIPRELSLRVWRVFFFQRKGRKVYGTDFLPTCTNSPKSWPHEIRTQTSSHMHDWIAKCQDYVAFHCTSSVVHSSQPLPHLYRGSCIYTCGPKWLHDGWTYTVHEVGNFFFSVHSFHGQNGAILDHRLFIL